MAFLCISMDGVLSISIVEIAGQKWNIGEGDNVSIY